MMHILQEIRKNLPALDLPPVPPPETETPQKEENQQVGVSTHYTLSETNRKPENKHPEAHWYALRTTYGREKKAYDYLVSQPSSKATLPRKPFLPTTTTAMC